MSCNRYRRGKRPIFLVSSKCRKRHRCLEPTVQDAPPTVEQVIEPTTSPPSATKPVTTSPSATQPVIQPVTTPPSTTQPTLPAPEPVTTPPSTTQPTLPAPEQVTTPPSTTQPTLPPIQPQVTQPVEPDPSTTQPTLPPSTPVTEPATQPTLPPIQPQVTQPVEPEPSTKRRVCYEKTDTSNWVGDLVDGVRPNPFERPPAVMATSYTPDWRRGQIGGTQSLIDQTCHSQARPDVVSQDPDGLPDSINWSKWDGVPFDIWELAKKPKQEVCDLLFPDRYRNGMKVLGMLGLREKFYQVNPFVDVKNPTPMEIDLWNVEVINHFRDLLGIKARMEPVKCLYLGSQWATERKHTTVWDKSYPDGVCGDGSGGHCGWKFAPKSRDDKDPYGSNCRWNVVSTEGLTGVHTGVPWSMKMSTILGHLVCQEKFNGHVIPFWSSNYWGVGMSFKYNPNGWTQVRLQWRKGNKTAQTTRRYWEWFGETIEKPFHTRQQLIDEGSPYV